MFLAPKLPKIKLDVAGDPVILKRRIIPFCLREAVKKSLEVMCDQGVLTPFESSEWTEPIVTILQEDNKTPRICGDYRPALNKRLM